MFQVSTLQALALGYSRPVITVGELLTQGDTGLGTFEDVDGEMILLDGTCYRATENGAVFVAEPDKGVPFASVCRMARSRIFPLGKTASIDELKQTLNNAVEEDFGLNSMHVVRIDGYFEQLSARSESALRSQHVTLKEVLKKTQKDYAFSGVEGSLVCVYYPDYMDGINAPGWHFHFISGDRRRGGHVFELCLREGVAALDKISRIEIRLPSEPAFDTYALKNASEEEIKQVEQGH